MIRELVLKTRTVRRYCAGRQISRDTLAELVDLSRFSGSARNSQSLRYMLATGVDLCGRIFPHLGWAGYLKDWPGPGPNERPAAYIICLLDLERWTGSESEAHVDLGISTQNMLLAAAEKGIYGCRIASISKKLAAELEIDDNHRILLVLALGHPAEEVVVEEMKPDGDVRYWRDGAGVHHVPKRSLEDVLYPPAGASSGTGGTPAE